MYHNVEIEMTKAKKLQRDLARELGITQPTLSLKLNGKSTLTLPECVKIKKILGSQLTIEELFKEDNEEEHRAS